MKMKNPIDMFFTMGDKVTGGDPRRKADFDYYLLWIILFAFGLIAYTNFKSYYLTGNLSSLGWGVVILCILWFQYGTLKMSYDARKFMKSVPKEQKFNQVENVKEMIEQTK